MIKKWNKSAKATEQIISVQGQNVFMQTDKSEGKKVVDDFDSTGDHPVIESDYSTNEKGKYIVMHSTTKTQ